MIKRAAACLLALSAMGAQAGSANPDEFPLRVHIYTNRGIQFYQRGFAASTKGTGRANLFENGEPRGFEYAYNCADEFNTSVAMETYPARWKKKNLELTILVARIGEKNKTFTCDLKVGMKDVAFFLRDGRLATESPAAFKEWMKHHDYDPEHGKDMPKFDEAPARSASR